MREEKEKKNGDADVRIIRASFVLPARDSVNRLSSLPLPRILCLIDTHVM